MDCTFVVKLNDAAHILGHAFENNLVVIQQAERMLYRGRSRSLSLSLSPREVRLYTFQHTHAHAHESRVLSRYSWWDCGSQNDISFTVFSEINQNHHP